MRVSRECPPLQQQQTLLDAAAAERHCHRLQLLAIREFVLESDRKTQDVNRRSGVYVHRNVRGGRDE